MRWIGGVMLAGGLIGCRARIPFEEQAVFQAKRTLDAHTFDFANATFEEVRIETADGVELYGWHIDRSPSQRTVLYFGGQGFHLVLAHDFVSRMLADVPVDLFVMDYRGYGRSEGEPRVEALKQDALRVFEVLTEERGVPAEEIVIHGHSMGSFIASHVAAEREVSGLVLESGLTNVDEWSKALVPGLFRLFLKIDIAPSLLAESNVDRVARIEAPSLFIVGSEDPITPPKLTEALFEASAATSKRVVQIAEGQHNDLVRESAYIEAYRTFVAGLPEDSGIQ